MNLEQYRHQVNTLVRERTPFLFAIDFELENPWISPVSQLNPDSVLFDFNGVTNALKPNRLNERVVNLKPRPVSFDAYRSKFLKVMQGLEYGDSFLANLTIRTPLDERLSLRDLFHVAKARYKLWMKNQFLVFSPESFVRTRDGWIYSYPMKGTIDASVPNAIEKVLSDQKEMSEHVTIVDLIRNDLSMIASQVQVKRFRYVEPIHSKGKTLLQVSSEIAGQLDDRFYQDPGGAILSLLPAGSISGAPKEKTIELIKSAEGEKRGFYTGICGIFDGQDFDSGVMIRFIEEDQGVWYYRSGGGVTTQSDARDEYQETLDKIYVPID